MSRMLTQRCQVLAILCLLYPAASLGQTNDPPGAPPAAAEAAESPDDTAPAAQTSEPAASSPPAADDTEAPEPALPVAPIGDAESTGKASASPAGTMDLSMPPPPPPRTRQARVHNGFYLRGGFGAGGLWPRLNDQSDAVTQYDLNGGTFSLNFEGLIGASPADGFALGGGAAWAGGTSSLTGDGADVTISTLLLGVFFDAFPRPKEGMHLGAMAGYALHFIDDHPSGVEQAGGIGGAAWLGYDWWVADEISAGLMLRFNGALTGGEDDLGKLRVNSTGLSILATALYH